MILLTGASGFLGRAISKELGALITATIGRSDCTFNFDLAGAVPVLNGSYDIVVHAAGKAHSVPKTKLEEAEFFAVNRDGTKNLLKALEQLQRLPKSFIFISSVSVYGVEKGSLIQEQAPLNATDAYGRSKIEAELIVKDWCVEHGIICTILRLPLLAGPNPPGNLGAMIKGIKKKYYFNIAGGKAMKSIVLAKDVAHIIPKVATIGGTYNLTDGYHPSFFELSSTIASQLGIASPLSMPMVIAYSLAKIGDLIGAKAPVNTSKLRKITSDLTFDDKSAREKIGWAPNLVLKDFKIS